MNILCSNKKATFRYAIIKKIEAGLILEGWEVKSVKMWGIKDLILKLENGNVTKKGF